MMVVCVTSPARLSHVVPFRSAWPPKPPPAPLPRRPPSPCLRMPAPRRPCAPPWPTPSPTTPPRSSPYRTIFMPIPRSDTASIMRWPRWLTSCGPMVFSPESGSTTWIRRCAPRSGRTPRSLPVLLVLPVPLAPLAPPVCCERPHHRHSCRVRRPARYRSCLRTQRHVRQLRGSLPRIGRSGAP